MQVRDFWLLPRARMLGQGPPARLTFHLGSTLSRAVLRLRHRTLAHVLARP